MKSHKKNYIGKGTQVENLDIVKITLKVEEILKYKYEFEGNGYITLEVARMQQPDKLGRSHTAYVSMREEADIANEEKPKRKSSKKKLK
ncbi:MAG: hypothetical protein L3J11_07860 [Draconibacterium sp.]|nr:hypothetical protein [Draconibacterium sp.]